MNEMVAEDVLEALSTEEFRALLERLPDQADDLRKRRRAIQHAQWRERNRDKKVIWDQRYYALTSKETPEQKRERWVFATRRYRARKKLAELEPKISALQTELKASRGKKRDVLKARLEELVAKAERLSLVADE